jgi:NitT/TauT family transport system substrate-binding protein
MNLQVSRRSILTIATGAAIFASRLARADAIPARDVYPVAIPLYATHFVAFGQGFYTEAGLDVKMIQGGSGVKMREIVASGQGDIGIGDITHPMQLTSHGRDARVLMAVDTRSDSTIFIIRKDLYTQGITTLEDFAKWKRPDGRKPILGVSSIGGTSHVWASYYMELFKLDQAVTWIGAGDVETMLGALKTKQIDVLASAPSLLKESEQQGWGELLFDGNSEANWNKYIGGKVPVTAHFTLLSTAQQDPAKIQAFTGGLWRATQWIKTHSPEEINAAIEPFVGSTSHDANVYAIGVMKQVADFDGTIDADSYARGAKVWFRAMTGMAPLKYEDIVAPQFLASAKQKYPG